MRILALLVVLAGCGRLGFGARTASDDVIDVDANGDAPADGPAAWQALAPIGYYPFDGTCADLAYAPGALPCSGTFQAGHRGSAILANGQAIPAHALASSDFTVAQWIYVPSKFPGMFAGCGTYQSAQNSSLEADDEPAGVQMYSLTNNFPPGALTPITGDAWNHVAMTYAASTRVLTLFVDGEQKRAVTEIQPDAIQPGMVGGASCAVLLDDLFLFDRVLTPAEIAQARDL